MSLPDVKYSKAEIHDNRLKMMRALGDYDQCRVKWYDESTGAFSFIGLLNWVFNGDPESFSWPRAAEKIGLKPKEIIPIEIKNNEGYKFKDIKGILIKKHGFPEYTGRSSTGSGPYGFDQYD